MGTVWIEFGVCLAIILVAGAALSHYGDAIAEKSGLGRTWIGVILLATVTSLPELFSGIGAVTFANVPDIAIGSLMGSCVFNLALIAPIDFISRKKSVYTTAGQVHILSAALGLILIGFVAFNLLLAKFVVEPSWNGVGASSPVIIIIYLASMSMLFRHERRQADERVAEASVRYGGISGRRVGALFAIAAVVVVTAAMWLPTIGDRMGEAMGWNESFVGTLFVAFATSAPELVVTLAAVRIGAIDLAIGNVLGSNLFNMAEVGLLDPLYRKGPLLTDVSASHAATAFTAVMMSGLVVVGLFYRPGRRVLRTVGWVSIVLAGLFLLNSFFVYYAQ